MHPKHDSFVTNKDVIVIVFVYYSEKGSDFWAVRHFTTFIHIFLLFLPFTITKNNTMYNDSIWWGDFQKQYFFLAHCFYFFLLKSFFTLRTLHALLFLWCFRWILDSSYTCLYLLFIDISYFKTDLLYQTLRTKKLRRKIMLFCVILHF